MLRRSILAAPALLAPVLLTRPTAAQQHPQAAAPQPVQAGDLAIARPWTRAAGQGGTGAGFMTITNRGAAADRLVGASTPLARTTEIHTHVREGEVMRMRPVPGIDLPPGQSVTLQPGSFHLMLIGLTQLLIPGQTVPVTLRFERAGDVPVELQVEAAGARGPTAR
ncbi:copper chaperone PCu(A)C [Paracraurococcus lichenis]|uniref:Copper chaperone PCu(A)C n=1 Tax=Paracraurococcus lichenis TaxID=3064888 RepID=A0ABT9DY17_9PROT|nr:copper chaperone PCu(A)C [Paracraurococcus sp. LOR1-02]MDO9708793.1 copper chaperone PCu(A)C [Paracraurococcus sp. LOR1-02]